MLHRIHPDHLLAVCGTLALTDEGPDVRNPEIEPQIPPQPQLQSHKAASPTPQAQVEAPNEFNLGPR
jgi:hypothetical protein